MDELTGCLGRFSNLAPDRGLIEAFPRHPFLVRELLLLSEVDVPIDPGYAFLLR